jgi:hypothetical protein
MRKTTTLCTVALSLIFAAGCGGSDDRDYGAGGTAGQAGASGGNAGSGSGGDSGSGATGGSATGGSGGDAGSSSGGVGGTGTGGTGTGGTGTGGTGTGGTGAGGTGPDTAAPTIVSIVPADAAIGVEKDENIVITFSEPMAKADTQAAYQSASSGITAAQVTFSWDATGTVLTIDPNASLLYQSGTDPATATAREYSFSMTTTATDLAGNPLAEQSDATFHTRRRITQALDKKGGGTVTDQLTGYFWPNAKAHTLIRVGDYDEGGSLVVPMRGFVTMDLSSLPDGIASFEKATLGIYQDSVAGTPYSSLGELHIYHMTFAALNQTTFDAVGPSSTDLGVFTASTTAGKKSFDVTDQVSADYRNRATLAGLSQYGLRFVTLQNNDSASDYAQFDTYGANTPKLTVIYLIP